MSAVEAEMYDIFRCFVPRTEEPKINFVLQLAIQAVERAGEIVGYIDGLYYQNKIKPTYYAELRDFKRWLNTISYRESLRLVLNPEPCERILNRLSEPQVRLLRYRYVDQFTDGDTARVLPSSKAGDQFDTPAARLEARTAYDALRALIRGQLSSPVNPKPGLYRGSESESFRSTRSDGGVRLHAEIPMTTTSTKATRLYRDL